MRCVWPLRRFPYPSLALEIMHVGPDTFLTSGAHDMVLADLYTEHKTVIDWLIFKLLHCDMWYHCSFPLMVTAKHLLQTALI